jgi:LemA protein
MKPRHKRFVLLGGLVATAGVIVALVFFVFSIYNGLVLARNQYKNAFAQIDVQLTRRHDLIPNLVETAKGYMAHERETLEAVVQARNAAVSGLKAAAADPGDPDAMKELGGAENQLTQTLGRLFALSESYPDLKANQNMMQLSEELASTENRVAFARQAYNDAVMAYNNKREVVPNNIIAGLFSFTPAQLLEIEDKAMRQAPKVSFG